MFSGIVEELGTVKGLSSKGTGYLLTVESPKAAEGTAIGDSIAVNGACLTVVGVRGGLLSFDVMRETRELTDIGGLAPGSRVNLERSLKMGDRISGHFVSGHVDCKGVIRRKSYVRGDLCIEIGVPARFIPLVLPKGSIAVDGVSLTVTGIKGNSFSVCVIPHTLASTTLGIKSASQPVNVEFDMMSKAARRAV